MRKNKLASLVLILLCVVNISGCDERELILQSRKEVQWKSQGEAGKEEDERERIRQLEEEAKRQSDALKDAGLDGVSGAF